MLKFFKNPFASAGTKTTPPATDPGTGAMSYPTGYGTPYQLAKTDPLSRNIERAEFNGLMFDVTNELKQLQEHGVPDYITAALNEGVAKAYAIGDMVRYDAGAGDIRVFVSRKNANTSLPTVAADWRVLRGGIPTATAGGTANAITAAFVPSMVNIQNGDLFLLEHTAANSSTTPTIAVDGGAAKIIVKANGVAVDAGAIPGANFYGLYAYDASLDRYVLLNPGDFVKKGGDNMLGGFGIVVGSVSTPGLAFSGDPNTGIAQVSGADSIDFIGGGARSGGFDANRNFTVNTTGSHHIITKAVGQGSPIFSTTDGANLVTQSTGASGAFSAAPPGAFATNSNSSNGRSICVPGTVNASGADYAEYETVASLDHMFKAGDVVGFNVEGKLTSVFADAVRFGIKSTNPNIVGGDTWGPPATDLPKEPAKPSPAEFDEPADFLDAQDRYSADFEMFTENMAKFRKLQEDARKWVDRIAYCGKVPVNIKGAKPGQYLVPAADKHGKIKLLAVDKSSLDFGQYLSAVGFVGRVLEDGRAEAVIKIG